MTCTGGKSKVLATSRMLQEGGKYGGLKVKGARDQSLLLVERMKLSANREAKGGNGGHLKNHKEGRKGCNAVEVTYLENKTA